MQSASDETLTSSYESLLNLRLSRRRLIVASLTGLMMAGCGTSMPQSPHRQWTVTGTPVSLLASFDDVMKIFMHHYNIHVGSLAVVKDARLVLAHAYTWAEPGYRITQPTSLFRIASCTKPLTSIAIHQLIEKNALSLETKVQQVLHLKDPEGNPPFDPRFNEILVWHLLTHSGGWDRSRSFDPMFYDLNVANAFETALPVTKYQIASFMADEFLQSIPGTQFAYSNFGYSLLGQMIEKLAGISYIEAIKRNIFTPLGLTRPQLGHSLFKDRAPTEVTYEAANPNKGLSVMTPDQPRVPLPDGSFNIENMDSHGGWIMAAPDYAKVLAAFDLEANPLLDLSTVGEMWKGSPGFNGYVYGWFTYLLNQNRAAFYHDGLLPGTRTLIFRRSDKFSFVAFFNKDVDVYWTNGGPLLVKFNTIADNVKTWPDIDLFPTVGIPPNSLK
jgi:CubicO group peptidase (beta-lactamase class C family)